MLRQKSIASGQLNAFDASKLYTSNKKRISYPFKDSTLIAE
jgi:hypothetical protein